MRTLTMIAIAALYLGGCVTAAGRSRHLASDADLAVNPFDTIAARPDVLLTAKLSGKLVFDGKCMAVETTNGSVVPLWPEGSHVTTSGRQQVISLPDKRGAVAIGRMVSLGGASFSPSDIGLLAPSVRATCPSRFFAVSTAK